MLNSKYKLLPQFITAIDYIHQEITVAKPNWLFAQVIKYIHFF